jgi:hypothetical protein
MGKTTAETVPRHESTGLELHSMPRMESPMDIQELVHFAGIGCVVNDIAAAAIFNNAFCHYGG